MAKGLQSWSVKEAGAPVTSAEIKQADSGNTVTFSSTSRAMMGVVAPAGTEALTLTLASGETIEIPGAAVASVFAPGSIVPFACDSFSFTTSETTFKVIALF